jgi:hypothetical protein
VSVSRISFAARTARRASSSWASGKPKRLRIEPLAEWRRFD